MPDEGSRDDDAEEDGGSVGPESPLENGEAPLPPPSDTEDDLDRILREVDGEAPADRPGPDRSSYADVREIADLLRHRIPYEPREGERIGSFEIVHRIGQGGMGIVYEALNLPLDRRVALKLLRPDLCADEGAVRRFEQEARLLARVTHPNLLGIYGVGVADGHHVIEMELLAGDDLHKLSAKEKLSEREALRMMAQVARACHTAHEHGVLHRDIKPENILAVGHPPTPYLIDFGLARLIDESRHTRTGHVMGTLPYMAPESVTGGKNAWTVQSDVFGLGATLWRLLTGIPPYPQHDTAGLFAAVARARRPAFREVMPGASLELARVIEKALAPLPADRYACAADMADDLEALLEGRPIAGRLPSRTKRLGRRVKKHPFVAVGMILALALLVLLVVPGLMEAHSVRTARARLQRIEAHYQVNRGADSLHVSWTPEDPSSLARARARFRADLEAVRGLAASAPTARLRDRAAGHVVRLLLAGGRDDDADAEALRLGSLSKTPGLTDLLAARVHLARGEPADWGAARALLDAMPTPETVAGEAARLRALPLAAGGALDEAAEVLRSLPVGEVPSLADTVSRLCGRCEVVLGRGLLEGGERVLAVTSPPPPHPAGRADGRASADRAVAFVLTTGTPEVGRGRLWILGPDLDPRPLAVDVLREPFDERSHVSLATGCLREKTLWIAIGQNRVRAGEDEDASVLLPDPWEVPVDGAWSRVVVLAVDWEAGLVVSRRVYETRDLRGLQAVDIDADGTDELAVFLLRTTDDHESLLADVEPGGVRLRREWPGNDVLQQPGTKPHTNRVVWGFAPCPDGKSMLVARGNWGVSGLYRYHFASRSVERLQPGPICALAWSGERYWFAVDGYNFGVDPATETGRLPPGIYEARFRNLGHPKRRTWVLGLPPRFRLDDVPLEEALPTSYPRRPRGLVPLSTGEGTSHLAVSLPGRESRREQGVTWLVEQGGGPRTTVPLRVGSLPSSSRLGPSALLVPTRGEVVCVRPLAPSLPGRTVDRVRRLDAKGPRAAIAGWMAHLTSGRIAEARAARTFWLGHVFAWHAEAGFLALPEDAIDALCSGPERGEHSGLALALEAFDVLARARSERYGEMVERIDAARLALPLRDPGREALARLRPLLGAFGALSEVRIPWPIPCRVDDPPDDGNSPCCECTEEDLRGGFEVDATFRLLAHEWPGRAVFGCVARTAQAHGAPQTTLALTFDGADLASVILGSTPPPAEHVRRARRSESFDVGQRIRVWIAMVPKEDDGTSEGASDEVWVYHRLSVLPDEHAEPGAVGIVRFQGVHVAHRPHAPPGTPWMIGWVERRASPGHASARFDADLEALHVRLAR